MYAQSHAVPWTQEYNQEESHTGYTEINSCTAMLNVTNPMNS